MKKIIGIGLLIFWVASCSSIFSPDQKIIMIDGPEILWPSEDYFYIGGNVQNIGSQGVGPIKILLIIRDSGEAFLAIKDTRINKIIVPSEVVHWQILFHDPGGLLRDKLDFAKLIYRISMTT